MRNDTRATALLEWIVVAAIGLALLGAGAYALLKSAGTKADAMTSSLDQLDFGP